MCHPMSGGRGPVTSACMSASESFRCHQGLFTDKNVMADAEAEPMLQGGNSSQKKVTSRLHYVRDGNSMRCGPAKNKNLAAASHSDQFSCTGTRVGGGDAAAMPSTISASAATCIARIQRNHQLQGTEQQSCCSAGIRASARQALARQGIAQ